MWMVRAGEGGYIAKDLGQKAVIAIGWNELGDLSEARSKEQIRSLYVKAYPDEPLGRRANAVAVVHKFRSVLKVGEKVITYDPESREYFVGEIVSDYKFLPDFVPDHWHVRKVRWDGRVSRDLLRITSRNSLGSTLTLFRVNKDIADELTSIMSGKAALDNLEIAEEEREELGQVRDETVERAHELIKDRLLRLSPDQMEEMVAAVLRGMGYKTRVSPKGRDRGVDVFASPDGLGLEEPRIKVEVKHRPKTKMGGPELRNFLGALRGGDRGLYVSTGGFTEDAKYETERATIPVTLVNLDDLARLIVSHYDKFDMEGRVLLPLARIYWPIE